jgi:phage tail protein X
MIDVISGLAKRSSPLKSQVGVQHPDNSVSPPKEHHHPGLAKRSSPLKSQVGVQHPDNSVSPLSLWERARVRGFAFMALNWLTINDRKSKIHAISDHLFTQPS